MALDGDQRRDPALARALRAAEDAGERRQVLGPDAGEDGPERLVEEASGQARLVQRLFELRPVPHGEGAGGQAVTGRARMRAAPALIIALLGGMIPPAGAWGADGYPTRAIRLIVPYP